MPKGQIIPRGKRTYQVRIPLGRDPQTKTRKYFTKTLHCTKAEAVNYCNRKILEIEQGDYIEPTQALFKTVVSDWLKLVQYNNAVATHETYKVVSDYYILPRLGQMFIRDITSKHVQDMLLALKEAGLSDTTIINTRRILVTVFRYAVTQRLIRRVSFADVKTPKPRRPQYYILTPQEAAKFAVACDENRYGLLFLIALITGMRPSECAGLRWSDIEDGAIKLQSNVVHNKAGGGWYESKLKNRYSKRILPLTPMIVQKLEAHRAEQTAWWEINPQKINRGYVFISRTGTPANPALITQRYFKPMLEQAGLPLAMRLYDLRHSCATILLNSGESPKVIAERLGHASVKTTLDIYTHTYPGAQQNATNKLESILFSTPADQTAHIEASKKKTASE